MAYVVLVTFLALVGAEVWSLFAKSSRAALAAACSGIAVCAVLFAYSTGTASGRYEWARPRYYSLPVDGSGTHTVVIKPIEGVPDYVVTPVPRGTRHEYANQAGEALPFPPEDVRRCGWRIVRPKINVHFHGPSCGCAPRDALFQITEPWNPNAAPYDVELEFRVNDETRPILAAIDLQVGCPLSYWEKLAWAQAIDGCIRLGTFGGMVLGAAALLAQLVRKRRAGATYRTRTGD